MSYHNEKRAAHAQIPNVLGPLIIDCDSVWHGRSHIPGRPSQTIVSDGEHNPRVTSKGKHIGVIGAPALNQALERIGRAGREYGNVWRRRSTNQRRQCMHMHIASL